MMLNLLSLFALMLFGLTRLSVLLKRIADEGWEIGVHLSQNGIATVLVHQKGL